MRALTMTLLLFLSSNILATSTPKLKVFEIVNRKRQPTGAAVSASWKWKKNAQGYAELFVQAKIDHRKFSAFQNVRRKSTHALGVLKNGSLIVRFKGNREVFALQSASKTMVIEIQAHASSPVIDNNCKDYKLSLNPVVQNTEDLEKLTQLPFYIGIKCGKSTQGTNLTMSYAESITIGASDIPETAGKGETWKYYELGPVKQAQESLGSYTFYYKNKEYQFQLEADKPKEGKTAEDTLILSGGLGYSMLKIEGFDISSSFSTPSLVLRVPFYPFVSNVGGSFDLDVAIPLGGTSSISYSQFSLYGAYQLELGSFWLFPKLGYMVFNQSDDTTGIGLSTNQIAIALQGLIPIGSGKLSLSFMMTGFGAASINSHYAASLGYFSSKGEKFGWGAGAKLQAFKATSSSSVQRTFNSTTVYGLLSF